MTDAPLRLRPGLQFGQVQFDVEVPGVGQDRPVLLERDLGDQRVLAVAGPGEKFDKAGDYVRRWCPELASLTGKDLANPSGLIQASCLMLQHLGLGRSPLLVPVEGSDPEEADQ